SARLFGAILGAEDQARQRDRGRQLLALTGRAQEKYQRAGPERADDLREILAPRRRAQRHLLGRRRRDRLGPTAPTLARPRRRPGLTLALARRLPARPHRLRLAVRRHRLEGRQA